MPVNRKFSKPSQHLCGWLGDASQEVDYDFELRLSSAKFSEQIP